MHAASYGCTTDATYACCNARQAVARQGFSEGKLLQLLQGCCKTKFQGKANLFSEIGSGNLMQKPWTLL
jgi:hypothetical protein